MIFHHWFRLLHARLSQQPEGFSGSVSDIQATLFDVVLVLLGCSMVVGIGLASLRAINVGWQPFMWLHVVMLSGVWGLVFMRRLLGYQARCALLLGLIFLSGIAGYVGLGPAADAKIAFVFIPFLSALFLPLRWTLLLWILQSLVLIALAVAWISGNLRFPLAFSRYASDPLIWATGIWSVVVYSGVVAYVAFSMVELLRRKMAHISHQSEAIAGQASLMQTMLDSMKDAVITIDEKGKMLYCNPAAEQCFGYTKQQLLNKNVKMLIPSPYHESHDSYLAHYGQTGTSDIIGQGREVEGLRADGSVFPMELSVSELIHSGARQFIGVARDITEQRRAQQIKNEFVATVSHELRTPLTAISGALGLINGGAAGTVNDKVRDLISIAMSNSHRLTSLINDILDFEKISAGKMTFHFAVQPLAPLLLQAHKTIQTFSTQHNVSLVLDNRLSDVKVNVDSQRLLQVLSNLLSNAIKFSPAGGVVSLRARRYGSILHISVIDQGPGVPNDFQSRLFERFAQADSSDTRKQSGTGLGLAISDQLMQAMQGAIGYQDAPSGQGGCFWIELPVSE